MLQLEVLQLEVLQLGGLPVLLSRGSPLPATRPSLGP